MNEVQIGAAKAARDVAENSRQRLLNDNCEKRDVTV
jgi:hypothetical protein